MQWDLIDRLGAVVPALGTERFSRQFYNFFQDTLDIDGCVVVAFRARQAPDPVLVEGRSPETDPMSARLLDAYASGAFEKDPIVPRGNFPVQPVVRPVSARDIPDRAYRFQFYEAPRVSHELVLMWQVEDFCYYSSFHRKCPGRVFHAGELELARHLARPAINLVHKHRHLVSSAALVQQRSLAAAALFGPSVSQGDRRELLSYMRNVLLEDSRHLTPREADICAGIILGYTSVAIGSTFGISVHTVTTHRKRAYQKLGISRQTELFSRYFRVIGRRLSSHAAVG